MARSGERAAPTAPRRRDHGRRADQAADEHRAEALGPAIGAVHGVILGARLKRSRHADLHARGSPAGRGRPDTARAGPTSRAPRRRASGRAARRPTSRPGRPRSEREARFVGKRGSRRRRRAGGARGQAAESSCSGPWRTGGTASSSRSSRTTEPDDADRPRRGALSRGRRSSTCAGSRGATWLHLSGYSLLRRRSRRPRRRRRARCRRRAARISIDLASAAGIVEYGADKLLKRLDLLGPDLVFANESEVAAIGGAVPGSWC